MSTIQPISETPKSVEELRNLGVTHRVQANGVPFVPQAALVSHFNKRGKAFTRRMSAEQLGQHLIDAGVHDAGAGAHDKAAVEWYGGHARAFERGLSKLFGYPTDRHHPTQVFAKFLLGITSANNEPDRNVDVTVRALEAGHGDFSRIPTHNETSLLHALRGDPHLFLGFDAVPSWARPDQHTSHEAGAWAHGKGYKPNKGPYYGLPALYSPSRKAVVQIEHQGKMIPVAPAKKRPPADATPIHLPILTATGDLQPKRWIKSSGAMISALHGLQRMIRDMGAEKAAEFLRTEHPQADVQAMRLRYFAKTADGGGAYLPPGSPVAGFLVAGEKRGSYAANIHDHVGMGKYLTADMWHARNIRRHMGAMKGGKEPITTPQRRVMYDIAQEVRQRTGVSSIAVLQALIWYAEQKLWRSYHQQSASGDLHDGINKALAVRGLPPEPLTSEAGK